MRTPTPNGRPPTASPPHGPAGGARTATAAAVTLACLVVLAALLWQALTAHGNPDPLAENLSPTTVVLQSGILVFREGLEAILVLAALTASLVRTRQRYWRPVALGAGVSLLASALTWVAVVALIDGINAPLLHIQAATGLLAVGVLLVTMNWFFHKVYWSGWIALHTRRKRALTRTPGRAPAAIYRGLVLLGLTAVYREGFEIVLFLQSLRLKAGDHAVYVGLAIGLTLTLLVAILTFVAHRRLPYRKMLVLTGVMLGGVLLVMVGESVQELQLAGWTSTTPLRIPMPAWLGLWLAVYPTLESLGSQVFTVALVLGSYFVARRKRGQDEPSAARTLDFDSSCAETHGAK